jgi:hypothetical protein
MGRLGMKEKLFLAEILHGFITRDYYRTAEVHFEAGYVPPRHSIEDFAQAIRAIGEPIPALPKIFQWRGFWRSYSRLPGCLTCARGRSCCCCKKRWW